MTLLQPSGLWFLLALPAIFILYLIQSRYRPQVVASLLLWKRMARDLEAEAAWRRPRWDALLALQLLVALLAALALARPAITGGGNESLVVVLDTSASMAAHDVQPTRFDAAKQQVSELVGSVAPNTQISLVTAGATPRVVVENGSAANVLGAMDGLQAGADAGDLPTALRVAAGLASPEAGNHSQVVAVTDGAVSLSLPPQPVPVSFKLVGGGVQDLAVSDVSLRRPVESSDYLAGFVRVVNFGSDPLSTTLAVLADGKLVDRAPIDVPPSSHSDATFKAPSDAQNLSIGLAERDALAADDRVDMVGYPRWARRVTIVSDASTMWEHVLSVVPNITTRTIHIADFSSADATPDDIYLFDNVVPDTLPKSGLIFVNPPDSSTSVLTRTDTLQRQRRAVNFDSQDPLLIGVDIAPLNVQQLERASTPAWAADSVSAEDTPLIMHGRLGDQRAVVFAFDPNKSNLPHLAAFPQLMGNAIDWLTPGRQDIEQAGLGPKADIQPRPVADLAASSTSVPIPSITELWPWLVAGALVVFALEWAVAVRRG
jgi:hypothetical protein